MHFPFGTPHNNNYKSQNYQRTPEKSRRTPAGWVLCTSLAIAGRQGSLAARARVARASGVRTLSSRSLEIIYLEAFGPNLREI